MIDDAWRLLNSTNEWVRFSDAKAAGALAGAGVLAGAVATAGLSHSYAASGQVAVIFIALAGLAALVAAGLAVYSLIPTLRRGPKDSLIYFDHVARHYRGNAEGHARAVHDLLADEDRYLEELAGQVWANSLVARSKFLASGWALLMLGLGVMLAGVGAVFTLFS